MDKKAILVVSFGTTTILLNGSNLQPMAGDFLYSRGYDVLLFSTSSRKIDQMD